MITREEALQTIHDCRITSLGELAHGYTVYQATANTLINQLFDQFESQLSSNPLQLACDGCNSTSFNHTFLKAGTWMGTKPLPSEFFRKSEYDFGWDYYPRIDTMQHTCKECGKVSYSLPKGTK